MIVWLMGSLVVASVFRKPAVSMCCDVPLVYWLWLICMVVFDHPGYHLTRMHIFQHERILLIVEYYFMPI